jgi:hypothetical protein
MDDRMASYNRVIDDVQKDLPQLRVVDSIPAVCNAAICSQKLRSGDIIYSDAIHLSPSGGRQFARRTGLPLIMMEEAIANAG